MARVTQYVRILIHICYIILLSYFIRQRSYKYVHIKRIDRYLFDMKHILTWTKIRGLSYEGQSYFVKNGCEFKNCYLTTNRSLFGDVRYFDALLFNVQDVSEDTQELPSVRSRGQRYIFVADNSADNYPVCNPVYDRFFNWTWTYRSDSTLSYKFICIYNKLHEEIGSNIFWKRKMKPIDVTIQNLFVTKSKAAAIFLDECQSKSKRELLLKNLQTNLSKYNLSVDVFGKCGSMQCKRRTMSPCYWRLKKHYYFYLALEDSLAYDYVTDIVLYGYKYNAVPIVYGGAEYQKFLPPNSYLDAGKLETEMLADTMYEILKKKEYYYNFFRWRNHYIIKEAPVLDACLLCEKLNNPKYLMRETDHKSFRNWWNPEFEKRCKVNNNMYLF